MEENIEHMFHVLSKLDATQSITLETPGNMHVLFEDTVHLKA